MPQSKFAQPRYPLDDSWLFADPMELQLVDAGDIDSQPEFILGNMPSKVVALTSCSECVNWRLSWTVNVAIALILSAIAGFNIGKIPIYQALQSSATAPVSHCAKSEKSPKTSRAL